MMIVWVASWHPTQMKCYAAKAENSKGWELLKLYDKHIYTVNDDYQTSWLILAEKIPLLVVRSILLLTLDEGETLKDDWRWRCQWCASSFYRCWTEVWRPRWSLDFIHLILLWVCCIKLQTVIRFTVLILVWGDWLNPTMLIDCTTCALSPCHPFWVIVISMMQNYIPCTLSCVSIFCAILLLEATGCTCICFPRAYNSLLMLF